MGISAGEPWTKIFLCDGRQVKFAFAAIRAGIMHSIAIHYDTLATELFDNTVSQLRALDTTAIPLDLPGCPHWNK